MNNMFSAFKITIPGTLIDDTQYFNYSDWDVTSTTAPTDAQTKDKAIAFVRYKSLMRDLSKYIVVDYLTIDYTTPGTAGTIPSDCSIVVGYRTIEPLVESLETQTSDKTQDACTALKNIVDACMNQSITEFGQIQYTYEKVVNPNLPTAKESYKESRTEYLVVPAVTPTVTVVGIEL